RKSDTPSPLSTPDDTPAACRRVQHAIEPSGFERLSRQAAWRRRQCFVDTPIDDQPLRPKYVPGEQSRDRDNWNRKFCPLFHFRISNGFDLEERTLPARHHSTKHNE